MEPTAILQLTADEISVAIQVFGMVEARLGIHQQPLNTDASRTVRDQLQRAQRELAEAKCSAS